MRINQHGKLVLCQIGKFGEVRLYTSLNSSAARFYACTDLFDVAATCLPNRCSPDQNGLARRGEVL